mmetsp:Transcript_10321/g.32889  ORF Transcript_10321/g.32889 Transcript_10321/m.32889 type:complete len:1110 (-) Transcript_10321:70-3399(-)
MSDAASDSSSDADLGEFIGLPDGFTEEALAGFESDDGEEEDTDGKGITFAGAAPGSAAKRKLAAPLYSLALVERLVIESDGERLAEILDDVRAVVEASEDLRADTGVIPLQMEVLRMAQLLAAGDFMGVIESPLVNGVIAAEDLSKHSVSRVKNRTPRFLHERVIEHIDKGLGEVCGSRTFRDPEMSSPENHVNQRVLRAVSCMFLAAACLNLYMQANWTGPPVDPVKLEKWYPLPYARGVYDQGEAKSKTNFLESAMEDIQADARATSVAMGKTAEDVEMDPNAELHARCALMMGANGEMVYRDSRLLHYMYTARIILRVMTYPTVSPSAVDPIDMLETAKIEEDDDEDEEPKLDQVRVDEMVTGNVRLALTHVITSSWWVARSATAHQETLESQEFGAPSLRQETDRGFKRSLKAMQRVFGENLEENGGCPELLSRLWLECGVACHKFKRVEDAKAAFHKARDAAGLEVGLSGKLGKRTKFQKEEKSQLVLMAASKTTVLRDEKANAEGASPPLAPTDKETAEGEGQEPDLEGEAGEAVPQNDWGTDFGKEKVIGIRKVKLEELDEYTPLHEKIQFEKTDDVEAETKLRGTLSLVDQSIVLALCMDVKNSYAMEGLTGEEMAAYVERVIQSPENWMVYSTALLIKSQLEFERSKTKERAVLQMQVLVDQQTDRLTPLQTRQDVVDNAAPVHERFKWLHALAWPALWELKRGLAQRYLELGVAGSALKIFEEVKLWEEAVDCLVIMDKRARAEELIRERLDVRPTANLMCVLGNLLQDPSWFEKAWEFSGKRYARAKRLWAIHAFGEGEYRESVKHMREALEINPLYPGSWFRLGAAAMRLEDWQLARVAFAHVAKQEPEDGDAWANLSSVHVKLGEFAAALKASAGAVKFSRNNWKIWENHISLAVQTNQWGVVIDGLSNLIDLRHARESGDQIDIQSLLLTVDALLIVRDKLKGAAEHGLDRASELGNVEARQDVSEELLDSWRAQLEALFDKFNEKCRPDPNAYKAMAVYFEGFGDLEKMRYNLLRRARTLAHQDGWERDESKLARIVNVLTDLHAKYSAAAASKDGDAKAAVMDEAVSLVRTAINRIKAGPHEEEAAPLEALLA